jgi:SAM-dependent methyltransferase
MQQKQQAIEKNKLTSTATSRCRFCGSRLGATFVDLGLSPLCESFVTAERLAEGEVFYPLHAKVCGECFLVQLDHVVRADVIFTDDYAYFSSYSESWLKHASTYVDMISRRLSLNGDSLVVELASNDGYLLQYFVEKGISVLGVEPSANVAEAAAKKGVPSLVKFFGVKTAREMLAEGFAADLIIGNNVLAHVPDINDFVAGIRILLNPGAVATLEFPHLARLIAESQYDTIYHEHFSYLSLSTVETIASAHGLVLFDVEELPTHGGSIRVYLRGDEDYSKPVTEAVANLRKREIALGLNTIEAYTDFTAKVIESKRALLDLLIRLRREGKTIAAYGAPGKGNTLLNYCGIRTDLLDFIVDRNPFKHGRFTPGTRIPIYPTEYLAEARPDYILILPWNLKTEIVSQLGYARKGWGAKFIVPIPTATVLD